MSKVIILGDTHFGARGSNQLTEHWQRRFYEDVFWPYVEENNIKKIIQTGDYFDNRQAINLRSLAFQQEVFVDKAAELGVEVMGIVGNHDIPLRHSLKNSSPVQIVNRNEHCHFTDVIQDIQIGDRTITLMPWICKENYEECKARIKQGGDIIVGHYEIEGFVMHAGCVSKEGINMSDFKGWNRVISGHYHTQSQKGNIQYVGTPYQMSWNDATSKHGFWVLDTFDDTMDFVENKLRYFNRLVWNDGCEQNIEGLDKTYVKITIKKKTDFESFEKFIDRVNFQTPHEVKIIESFEEFNQENVSVMIQGLTTEDLISEYVEDVATDTNKESVKKILLTILDEANNLEE